MENGPIDQDLSPSSTIRRTQIDLMVRRSNAILPLVIALLCSSLPAAPIDTPLGTHSDLDGPGGVAWTSDNKLVTAASDTGHLMVEDGPQWRIIASGLVRPLGIDVDPDGSVFVAESGRHRILRINQEGTHLQVIDTKDTSMGPMRIPMDVDAHEDFIVVADTGNDRILVLDRQGSPVQVIGERGTGPGQFRRPSSVAVLADGRIAVADTDNHRVQVFQGDGQLLARIGSRGSHPGLMAQPTGIDASGGIIRVADQLNHRVQSFSPDGKFLHAWGMHALKPREGTGRIHYPTAIAVSNDGTQLAVAEPFEERIQVFGPHDPGYIDERPSGAPRSGIQSHFGPVVSLEDRILVVWEPESQVAIVFDHQRRSPIRLTSLWSNGDGPQSFGNLVSLDWDAANSQLHMLDAAQGQYHAWTISLPPPEEPRFDPDMGRLTSTRPLPASIEPSRIVDAARTPDGRWYLLDGGDGQVHVLGPSMELLDTWNSLDEFVDDPLLPEAIVHDTASDTLLILSRSRVFRFDRSGSLTRLFKLEDMERPDSIAVGADGSIYVTDTGKHSITRFDKNGSRLARWGSRGTDHAQFWRPAGIVVDADDRVFVLDHGNHRCQVFEPDGTWLMTFGAGRSYSPNNLPLGHPLRSGSTP